MRSYFNRYSDDALDLCDVLGSYVPGGKVKLEEVSKILGLTGKPEGVDGGRVEGMVLAGQIDEVAHYCESHMLDTYRVWLVYELFRGSITSKELDWSEVQIRDFVATRNQLTRICMRLLELGGVPNHERAAADRHPSRMITYFPFNSSPPSSPRRSSSSRH